MPDKQVKVLLLKDHIHEDRKANAGNIIKVSEKRAETLITCGVAKAYKPLPKVHELNQIKNKQLKDYSKR